KAAGNNANFLLNVGPTATGKIQPEFVERLQVIGAWLKKNGASVYGTRGGPVPPQPWGVTTRSKAGDKVYAHVLDGRPEVRLPKTAGRYTSAALLHGGPVGMKEAGGDVVLSIPATGRDPIDTIVVLVPVKKEPSR